MTDQPISRETLDDLIRKLSDPENGLSGPEQEQLGNLLAAHKDTLLGEGATTFHTETLGRRDSAPEPEGRIGSRESAHIIIGPPPGPHPGPDNAGPDITISIWVRR
jgi:hypothetical protein